VRGLIDDEDLPKKYFAELCYKIRNQINSELEWKFDLLVKTFKSIHKDRESPKLNSILFRYHSPNYFCSKEECALRNGCQSSCNGL